MVGLQNNLKKLRLESGLTQQMLADRAEISRQAYSAVEAGDSNPSTELAFRLARSLQQDVESVFSLSSDPPETPDPIQAELVGELGGSPRQPGSISRTRVYRVEDRLFARPLTGSANSRHSVVAAEGTIVSKDSSGKSVLVQPFARDELDTPSLAILGCDPAAGLLDPELRRKGVRLVAAEESSLDSLLGLAHGQAHVAGCHLFDSATGTFNRGWVSRLVPFPCTLVAFASWQQGLIIAPGNPKGILEIESLGNPGVTIVNRQKGSGSRVLLDRMFEKVGIPGATVIGYEKEEGSHMGVAAAVASGTADAGVGVKAAALAMGLDFIPLGDETYDLVIPDQLINEIPVQTLLDVLRHKPLHRRVESLGGYDASRMGLPA